MIIKPIPTSVTDQTVVWQDEEANHRFIFQARSQILSKDKGTFLLLFNLSYGAGTYNDDDDKSGTTRIDRTSRQSQFHICERPLWEPSR
ncbi:hypothetical protein BGX24_003356 [Mortierella sp. AD032]|nr:hypothetical protein BGX24_003356 [Mortierella sp. AD032]